MSEEFQEIAGEIKRLGSLLSKATVRYERKISRIKEEHRRVNHENDALRAKLNEFKRKFEQIDNENSFLKKKLEEQSTIDTEISRNYKRFCVLDRFYVANKFFTEGDVVYSPYSENNFLSLVREGNLKHVKKLLNPSKFKAQQDVYSQVINKAFISVLSGSSKNVEFMKFLLEHGADPKLHTSNNKRSVLQSIVMKNNLEVLDLILPLYDISELDMFDEQGFTPLQLACKFRKTVSISKLIEIGCDLNIRTNDVRKATARELYYSQDHKDSFVTSRVDDSIWSNKALLLGNYSRRGIMLSKKKELLKAIEMFSSAIDLMKNSHFNQGDQSRLFFNRAKLQFKIGNIFECSEDVEKAIAYNQNYSNAYKLLLDCHKALFNFDKAAELVKRMISMRLPDQKYQRLENELIYLKKCANASHYDILGIAPSATDVLIKKAFKQASMKWHPDKHMNSKSDKVRAGNHFQRINTAKMVLLNSTERKNYNYSHTGNLRSQQLFPWVLADKCKPFYKIFLENTASPKKTKQSEASDSEDSKENNKDFIDLTQSSNDEPEEKSSKNPTLDVDIKKEEDAPTASPFPFNWKNSGLGQDFRSAGSGDMFSIGKTKPKTKNRKKSKKKSFSNSFFFETAKMNSKVNLKPQNLKFGFEKG